MEKKVHNYTKTFVNILNSELIDHMKQPFKIRTSDMMHVLTNKDVVLSE